MEATRQLSEEHRVIEKAIPMLARLPEAPSGAAEVLEFFQIFVERCHHGKEELHLFPALEARGALRREGLVLELLKEHGVARRYLRDLAGLLHPATVDGNESSRQLLAERVRDLAALLQEHLAKEEDQLWPLVARTLTAEDDAALVTGFAALQRDLIGERDYCKYLNWARLWA
jgi:hemerythrin-like domain-containing protein